LCGHYGTSFINYPVQNRGERGWLPTCGKDSSGDGYWRKKREEKGRTGDEGEGGLLGRGIRRTEEGMKKRGQKLRGKGRDG
jgi:hypothetical protein